MSHNQVQFFLTMRDQLKIYHWQTTVFARHKATDEILKSLDEQIDLFVEVSMGKYGRPRLTKSTNSISLRNMTEKTATKFVKDCIQTLLAFETTSPDLSSIRDDMLANLNKLLYLFTLK